MQKFYILLLLLTAAERYGAAQESSAQLIEAESVVITPSGTYEGLKKLPFAKLVVVDRRLDTSKAGYLKKGNRYKKIVLQQPLAQAVQGYLQEQCRTAFDGASPYTLVVVLKNLWLQQTSAAEQEHHKVERSSEATAEFGLCTATWEAYAAAGDVYIPLFRADSSYQQAGGLKRTAETLIVKPFDDCLQRTAALDISKIHSARKKLSWAEIEAYNNQRLKYPRFETDVVEKGIYKTFQDFLQNRVTKQEFTVEYGVHTDEVFVKENGQPVALTDFWGFCDGTKNYIRIGMSVFELARQQHTYDILGSKLSIHKYYHYTPKQAGSISEALIGTALLNKNRMVTELKPLQLNMETGAVY